MNKYSIRLGLLCAALNLVVIGFDAHAQPGSGGPIPGAAPIDTPLDGGASLLLAAGATYGLKRLRRLRQNRP